MKQRKITVIYTNSDDPNFGTYTREIALVEPDIIFDRYDGQWEFAIIPPVKPEQNVIEIDYAIVPKFSFYLLNPLDQELDVEPEFIAKASLLNIVRKYANSRI